MPLPAVITKPDISDKEIAAQRKTQFAMKANHLVIDHKKNLETAQTARTIVDAAMGGAFMSTVALAQINSISSTVGTAAQSMASGGGHTTVAFAGINAILSLGHMAHAYIKAKKEKNPKLIKDYWLGESGLKTLLPAGAGIAAGACMIVFAAHTPLVIMLAASAVGVQNVTDIIYNATKTHKAGTRLNKLKKLQDFIRKDTSFSTAGQALALLGPELLYKHGFLGENNTNSNDPNQAESLEQDLEAAIETALKRKEPSANIDMLIKEYSKRIQTQKRQAKEQLADPPQMPSPEKMRELIEAFKDKELSSENRNALTKLIRNLNGSIVNNIDKTNKEIKICKKKLIISCVITACCATGLTLVGLGVTSCNPIVLGIGAAIMAAITIFAITMGVIGLVKKYKQKKSDQKSLEADKDTKALEGEKNPNPTQLEPPQIPEAETTDLSSFPEKEKLFRGSNIRQPYCPSKGRTINMGKNSSHDNTYASQTRVNTLPSTGTTNKQTVSFSGSPPNTKNSNAIKDSGTIERTTQRKPFKKIRHNSQGKGIMSGEYNDSSKQTESSSKRRVAWISKKPGASLADYENADMPFSPNHRTDSTGSFQP